MNDTHIQTWIIGPYIALFQIEGVVEDKKENLCKKIFDDSDVMKHKPYKVVCVSVHLHLRVYVFVCVICLYKSLNTEDNKMDLLLITSVMFLA